MFSKDKGIQRKLFDFVDKSGDAYAVFSAEDTLIYCNGSFASIFNSECKDLMGKTFEDLAKQSYELNEGLRIDADDLEGWLQYAQSVRRSKDFRIYEVNLTDGSWFLFSEQLNDKEELLVHAKNITEQKRLEERIQQSNHKLRQLALTDELTGIANRRCFTSSAEAELNRCWRSGAQAALMVIDIDHFKNLNDQHGHQAGDAALVHMASLIRQTLREYDIFGRLGGEEFGIFLGQADADLAEQIAERIRHIVEEHPVRYEEKSITMTVSIGLTKAPCDTPYDQLFEKADEALYKAKEGGRNRVIVNVIKASSTPA
ncbi:GGDEF domain-containing protein [Hahella ganghwensis]|uniref:GGDEF domain-containing protein n=1 Tax=Hahella ganghwensis TaxID=286420 RepID=UPI000372B11B|nr:sensor domain-containing diguanylate cyclase [Hahella ganghwensis]